jgi:hypothetical protein
VLAACFGALVGVSCGGKVLYSPGSVGEGEVGGGGGDDAGGSESTSSSGKPNLKKICKKFCDAYASCAPVADCMNGCMISAFPGCEQEYADAVVCITGALVNCNVPDEACVAELTTYEACQQPGTAGSNSAVSAGTGL